MDVRVVRRLRSSATAPPTARVNSGRQSARSQNAIHCGSEGYAAVWASFSGMSAVGSRAYVVGRARRIREITPCPGSLLLLPLLLLSVLGAFEAAVDASPRVDDCCAVS